MKRLLADLKRVSETYPGEYAIIAKDARIRIEDQQGEIKALKSDPMVSQLELDLLRYCVGVIGKNRTPRNQLTVSPGHRLLRALDGLTRKTLMKKSVASEIRKKIYINEINFSVTETGLHLINIACGNCWVRYRAPVCQCKTRSNI